MKVNPNIFRGYDIRGIAGKDLTPDFAYNLGRAFGAFLNHKGIYQAIVGQDCRISSPEYSREVVNGLNWAGIDVIDIGLNLVGTFYWSQYHLKCRGGVYVTASHNPAEYNGFKLAIDFSETLVSDDIQELRSMIEREDFIEGEKRGNITHRDVRSDYIQDLLKRIVLKKKFRVVVDPGFSTAGIIVPDLLRMAGCDVVEKNCVIDSSFPLGTPDPIDIEVVRRLGKEVLEAKADLGLTYDADGDRIGIVDEKGGIVWNDVLVALFAKDVLNTHPGETIMYNTLCSKVVEESILQSGGKPFMWRTGHSFLKKKNQEIKAAFIGELSGHFFFSADFYNHDDGVYSSLRLLKYLADTNKSLSETIDKLPKYVSSPEIKIYCDDNAKIDLIKKIAPILKADFPDAEIIDDERAGDGVRADFEDGMFVIRYSQNAPYMTVKFEGKTQARYDQFRIYIDKILHSYPEVDWSSNINQNTEFLSG